MDQNTPKIENTNKIETKICKGKCGQEKELILFPQKGKGKLSNWCKQCHKDYSKEHYRKHADKRIAQTREWQEKNKDKVKNYMSTYKKKGSRLELNPPEKAPESILQNILPISPNDQSRKI